MPHRRPRNQADAKWTVEEIDAVTVLDETAFTAFVESLTQPPRHVPAIRDAMKKAGVLRAVEGA